MYIIHYSTHNGIQIMYKAGNSDREWPEAPPPPAAWAEQTKIDQSFSLVVCLSKYLIKVGTLSVGGGLEKPVLAVEIFTVDAPKESLTYSPSVTTVLPGPPDIHLCTVQGFISGSLLDPHF